MKGIKIVINDSFSQFTRNIIDDEEGMDGVALTTITSSRSRLQHIADSEDRERLVKAVENEISVLSYAAELYAEMDEEALFDSLSNCIDDYKKLRDDLIALEE